MLGQDFTKPFRSAALMACLAASCAASAAAFAQADSASAIAALRSAASAGNADAQVTLAGLLDTERTVRNDEALDLYEKAARSGNRLAQRRYLEMQSRPAPKAAVPLRAFTFTYRGRRSARTAPRPTSHPAATAIR